MSRIRIHTPTNDITRISMGEDELMYYNKEENKVILLVCRPTRFYLPYRIRDIDTGDYRYYWYFSELLDYCKYLLNRFNIIINDNTAFVMT